MISLPFGRPLAIAGAFILIVGIGYLASAHINWLPLKWTSVEANFMPTYIMGQGDATNGATIMTCEGTFYDSGGAAGNYGNNENTAVTFCADNGGDIIFDMQSLEVEQAPFGGCPDRFWLYDGTNTSGAPFTASTGFCGSLIPAIITSTTGCLHVVFQSNPNNTREGWVINISCTAPPDPNTYIMGSGAATDGSMINTCVGTFYDSGGAGGDYGNSESTAVTFCADNGGEIIFDIASLVLENPVPFCGGCCDQITFYDGTSTSSPIFTGLNAVCGSNAAQMITSTSGCIHVVFSSDNSGPASGWEIGISCTQPPGDADYTIDDGGTQSVCSGTFTDSGDTNGDYSDGENHTMTFCSADNNQISFTFENFNVATGDALEIFDGTSTGASSLGSFSGFGQANSPGVVTSSGECLTFQFTSDGSGTAPGWRAEISCTGTPDPGASGGSWTGYPGSNCGNNTEVAGTVYEDVEHDGNQGSRDFGVGGITVTLYDDNGQVGSPATTDINGDYSFTGLTASTTYRVEFTLPDFLTEGPYGPASGTAVQFVESGTCNVNLGLVDIAHYCHETDPYFVIPCYVNGDPGFGTNANDTGIARFRYSDSGDSQAATYENYVTAGAIGTVWGTTFSGERNTLYMSSLLKRHAGIGPGGIGAIYAHVDGDPNTSASVLYDFGAAAGTLPTMGARFPGPGTVFGEEGRCGSCDNIDPDVFGDVGKVGFGDIELSDNQDDLYVTNLYDRKVYRIDINNPTAAVPLPGIPWLDNSVCNNGIARPWALEFRRGKLFVGVVCDASTSGCTPGQACSDLTAEVYSFDGTSWTNELSVGLDYYREAYTAGSDYFVRWIDNWSTMAPYVANVTDGNFAQPIVMDIEFDDDNHMVLGIGDRTGLQLGYQAPPPPGPAGSTAERNMAFGDILRAAYNSNTNSYTIENNGIVGSLVTTNPNSSSGIGGRSFYWGDYWTGIAAGRWQAAIGSLSILPGSGEVMTPLADAIDYYSNGVVWINNTNGANVKRLEVYQGEPDGNSANFAKGSGVGDLELFCEAAPIEIGNIVWWDDNLNGLQDPSEQGIAGLTLELWHDPNGSAQGNGELDMGTAVKVAETTTDTYGRYIFSYASNSNGLSSENWSFTAANEVLPNTFYQVRIPNWETNTTLMTFASNLGYVGFLLAPTQNQGAGGGERDNNAYDNPGNAAGAVATGEYADNDHNVDFAFGGIGGCDAPTVVPSANTPCVGEDLILAAAVTGGMAPYTYEWTGPGGFTSDQQNPTVGPATGAMDGAMYTLVVTDAAMCSETVTITVAINELAIMLTPTDANCGASDGSIDMTITVGMAPYIIDWDNNGTGDTDDPEDISGLGAGTYSVTVTDADGCTATASAGISSSGAPAVTPTVTNETCTAANGSISLSITPAFGNITWSTGTNANMTSLTGLSAGSYAVTVFDAGNTCETILTFALTDTPGPTVSTTTVDDTCGDGVGNVDLTITGGTAPYDIDWDNNGTGQTDDPEDLSGLTMGTYAVTVTDANMCTATTSVTINNTAGPTLMLAPADETCSNSNGAVTLTVNDGTAPFSYEWSNGLTSQNISGLGAGTYSVTVTDDNGCEATGMATISDSPGPSLALTPTPATDCNSTNGSVTMMITNGTATFMFAWTHIESGATYSTQNLTSVPAGTYQVIVTDANGCVANGSTVVGLTSEPMLDIAVTDPANCSETGSATLTITGGVGPFDIDWSNDGLGDNDDDLTVTGLEGGAYSVIVTDANGCTFQNNASIRVLRDPVIMGDLTMPTCGGSNGAIDITVSDQDGGGMNLEYDWDNDGVGDNDDMEDLTGLPAGNFTVIVTNSLGCAASMTFSLSDDTAPELSFAQTNPMCGGDSDGSIDMTVTGGTMPFTYQWDNDGTADNDDMEDISGLMAGTYSVTVIDGAGCTATGSVTLTGAISPEIMAVVSPVSCAGGDGAIDVTVRGVADFTYDWSHIMGNDDPEDVSGLGVGMYTLTVTGGNGCTASSNLTVVDDCGTPPCIDGNCGGTTVVRD